MIVNIIPAVFLAAAVVFHPPVGPHTQLKDPDFAGSQSFKNGQKIVFTPYFYWYDVESGAHIRNGDGTDALTTHPPSLKGFTFRSEDWHYRQLTDMMEAGIDVLLPVYWGEPSARIANAPVGQQPWSFAGLVPLISARSKLVAEGRKPPRIGMFYDTSTLQWNHAHRRIDLTTDEGRQWFYETIRDFFSLVPPMHWAMIDGRPVIFLYAASFAGAYDQTCINHLKEAFASDFGGRVPFVVKEVSWKVETDGDYAWGGALGLKNHSVASLGPGYDHSAVPGRTPLVVLREGGDFYEQNWKRFLRKPVNMVFLETWNEYHEGTDIAESREYGRKYISLTREYVDMFRKGERPVARKGRFSQAESVELTCDATNALRGIKLINVPDGIVKPDNVDGIKCLLSVTNSTAGRYMYFRIDDSFKSGDMMEVNVGVDYHDGGAGCFGLQFDGSDTNALFSSAYTDGPVVIAMQGSNAWKTATFRLNGAVFANGENGGADFRIVIKADPFRLRRISVSR